MVSKNGRESSFAVARTTFSINFIITHEMWEDLGIKNHVRCGIINVCDYEQKR